MFAIFLGVLILSVFVAVVGLPEISKKESEREKQEKAKLAAEALKKKVRRLKSKR